MGTNLLPCEVKEVKDLKSSSYDGIILVSSSAPGSADHPDAIRNVLKDATEASLVTKTTGVPSKGRQWHLWRINTALDKFPPKLLWFPLPFHSAMLHLHVPPVQPPVVPLAIDNAVATEGGVFKVDLPAKRVIFSPIGPLDSDYGDARSFTNAAHKGIARALKAGVKAPLLILPAHPGFKHSKLVTLLGALESLYVNLQLREDSPGKGRKVKTLGVWSQDSSDLPSIIKLAIALESGRYVARDIGGSDPERMAPPRVEEYIQNVFGNSSIKVEVISDLKTLQEEYPLFAAVDRAAYGVKRHRGRIVYLTYEPTSGSVDRTLFIVGKGVTYDTGGADVKVGGVMAGMSRDKCGAAAAAGFMQVVSMLKPRGIRVVAGLPIVRNSIGSDAYVADEIIMSRNKSRVRIGNTDAEGRMIMGDVLCQFREMAVKAPNPHLMTIATLTGHAVLTFGLGYSVVMDNGPARKESHAQNLQAAADEIGDMFEISTIRKEDFDFHKGKGTMGDDIMQANNKPSTQTPRGHQGPAAFLMMISGLDKHGSDSETPLKFSHFDIAPSAGDVPCDATGAPVVGMAAYYLQGCF